MVVLGERMEDKVKGKVEGEKKKAAAIFMLWRCSTIWLR